MAGQRKIVDQGDARCRRRHPRRQYDPVHQQLVKRNAHCRFDHIRQFPITVTVILKVRTGITFGSMREKIFTVISLLPRSTPNFEIGVFRSSLPCSTSCMINSPEKVFVTDAIRNVVAGVVLILFLISEYPKPLENKMESSVIIATAIPGI